MLALVCIVYLQFQQNRLLQYQRSYPNYVPQAGQRTHSLNNTLVNLQTFGFLALVFTFSGLPREITPDDTLAAVV